MERLHDQHEEANASVMEADAQVDTVVQDLFEEAHQSFLDVMGVQLSDDVFEQSDYPDLDLD